LFDIRSILVFPSQNFIHEWSFRSLRIAPAETVEFFYTVEENFVNASLTHIVYAFPENAALSLVFCTHAIPSVLHEFLYGSFFRHGESISRALGGWQRGRVDLRRALENAMARGGKS
jgi:hypothetical protein